MGFIEIEYYEDKIKGNTVKKELDINSIVFLVKDVGQVITKERTYTLTEESYREVRKLADISFVKDNTPQKEREKWEL